MFTSTVLKAVQVALLLVAKAHAEAVPSSANLESGLPEGYTEVDVEWELKSHPKGEVFYMNGTVEKIHAELLKRNPNYETDFDLTSIEEEEDDEYDDESPGGNPLERRGSCARDWSRINCDINRQSAFHNRIAEGVSYLRRVPGKPRLRAGPRVCGRVSCSYSSGIFWCNDYNRPWSLRSFNSIANGAAVSPRRRKKCIL